MAFLTLEKIENYLDGFEIALSQIDRIRVEEIINQAKELYQPIQIDFIDKKNEAELNIKIIVGGVPFNNLKILS